MAHKGEDENGSHYNKGGSAIKNKYSKKKRTSFVNDNSWWSKLSEGFKNIKRGGSYSPQKMVRRMEFREGLSSPKKELTPKDDRWWNEGYKKEGALLGYTEDQVEMQRKYNKRLKKSEAKEIKPSDLSYDHSVEGHMSRLKDGGRLTGRAAYLPGIRGQLKAESYEKFRNEGLFTNTRKKNGGY